MCVGQCKPSHLVEVVTSLLLLMTILVTVDLLSEKEIWALEKFKEVKVAVERDWHEY